MSEKQNVSQPASVRNGNAVQPPALTAARPPHHDLARPESRDTLLDLLDRVLDKGVVIAGDISISLLDIELLTIKIRLLIASVDKAREMGIDWWAREPHLSGPARSQKQSREADDENKRLRERVRKLEERLAALPVDQREDRAKPRGALHARHGQSGR